MVVLSGGQLTFHYQRADHEPQTQLEQVTWLQAKLELGSACLSEDPEQTLPFLLFNIKLKADLKL